MDQLSQTLNAKEAYGNVKNDQKLLNEAQDYKRVRQNEVNNLKTQLSKEYNQGLIPKEYYDERIEQLNANNFETSLAYRFAGGVQVNPALQNFQDELLKDVDNDDMVQEEEAVEVEAVNEKQNDGPAAEANE